MSRIVLSIALVAVFLVSAQALDGYNCEVEGRFADPINCENYVNCVRDTDGKLSLSIESCMWGAFHPTEKKCVEASKVDNCKVRSARAFDKRPEYDEFCADGVTFTCASCNKLVTCIDGAAFLSPCTEDQSCENSDLFGGVCKASSLVNECTCSGKEGDLIADPYNQGSFVFCTLAGGRVFHQCPEKEIFSSTLSRCTNLDGTTDIDLPNCQEHGFFSYADNCTVYYSCTRSKSAWLQYQFTCPNGEQYNEETNACEDPCTLGPNIFTKCIKEGRFPDSNDCHRYFECIANPAATGGYDESAKLCPFGSHWNADLKNIGLGACVIVSESNCNSKRKKCTRPADCPADFKAQEEKEETVAEAADSNLV